MMKWTTINQRNEAITANKDENVKYFSSIFTKKTNNNKQTKKKKNRWIIVTHYEDILLVSSSHPTTPATYPNSYLKPQGVWKSLLSSVQLLKKAMRAHADTHFTQVSQTCTHAEWVTHYDLRNDRAVSGTLSGDLLCKRPQLTCLPMVSILHFSLSLTHRKTKANRDDTKSDTTA